ncbi:hypothetical protein GQ55_3G027900 [Panicum hallii var. hallii]|uniref:Uncharacterized protein n=1 Tax=Panicum hallii var. hallii TaxID=1504633 RepID=A0A2T7E548_9POAL|nr:hypothetical protein GQ55_3G027900 [Panicum hallii var. hallii]
MLLTSSRDGGRCAHPSREGTGGSRSHGRRDTMHLRRANAVSPLSRRSPSELLSHATVLGILVHISSEMVRSHGSHYFRLHPISTKLPPAPSVLHVRSCFWRCCLVGLR